MTWTYSWYISWAPTPLQPLNHLTLRIYCTMSSLSWLKEHATLDLIIPRWWDNFITQCGWAKNGSCKNEIKILSLNLILFCGSPHFCFYIHLCYWIFGAVHALSLCNFSRFFFIIIFLCPVTRVSKTKMAT